MQRFNSDSYKTRCRINTIYRNNKIKQQKILRKKHRHKKKNPKHKFHNSLPVISEHNKKLYQSPT